MPMRTPVFVLSIYPSVRGYAFVLFDGPQNPFDWGTKDIDGPGKNRKIVAGVTALIERYQPVVLIMEDFTDPHCRRAQRIRRLYRSLIDVAHAAGVPVRLYTRSAVRRCFEPTGAATKAEIAQAVARRIPAFKHRLPPVRKVWMSEDRRQWLFDAAAQGMVFYAATVDEPDSSDA